ncbi:MAG TPA: DNA repair exonuclease [Candidatus Marinimicrobia bacterium]|nr:DNA repair exonuclease [Candidatus Neomarinimicrobiota bacterium]
MVKFLLTADWQIGMEASSLGEKAERVRNARLDTIERIVQIANEKKVDFMVVAGDTFEGNDIPRPLIHKIHQALEKLDGIPVYFLPGNHDYFGPASVYKNHIWDDNKDMFIVLTEREPMELETCILYPCPIYRPTSPEDPTGWIEAEKTKLPRLGIAHGSLGILPEADTLDYPIDAKRAESAKLDFLCLGHWHSYLPNGERTLYPGTPETTSFKEKDSGYVAIINIEKGQSPCIEKIPTGALTWMSMEREINSAADLNLLKGELSGVKDTKRTLLRLKVTGMVPPEMFDLLDDLRIDLEERYLYSNIDMEGVAIDEMNTDILDLAPPGPIREALDELIKEAKWNPVAKSAVRSFVRISKEVGD